MEEFPLSFLLSPFYFFLSSFSLFFFFSTPLILLLSFFHSHSWEGEKTKIANDPTCYKKKNEREETGRGRKKEREWMRWSEKKGETSSSSFNWIDVFLLDTSKLLLPDVRKRTVQFLPLFLGIFCKSREREREEERKKSLIPILLFCQQ